MSHYPQDFPTVEAQRIYGYVSTSTLRDNIPQAAEDGWWLQGYLQKFAIGEADAPGADPTTDAFLNSLASDEMMALTNLSCLAGITAEDLAQPGEEPGRLLDNIDVAKLLTTVQSIVAMLKMLGIIP